MCGAPLPGAHRRCRPAHPPAPARSELLLVGGGSKNGLWRRLVADAFQLPLRFPAEPEAAALGAALQAAAVHTGTPVAEYVEAHPPPMGARCALACCTLRLRRRRMLLPLAALKRALAYCAAQHAPAHRHPLRSLAEEEVMQPHPAAAAAYAEAFQRHQRWGNLLYGGGSSDV